MEIALFVLGGLAVVGFGVAYRMNRLGLFVSREQMREDQAQAKERMRPFRAAGAAKPGSSETVVPGPDR